jgi:ferritin-like metal-binding protein YciE
VLSFEVLPELLESIKSEGLHEAVTEHLVQTREHGPRLEEVFRAVGAEPSSNLSPPAEKLAQHHDELAGNIPDDRLADVFHAAAAAATEHLELAMYDAVLALADAVELADDALGKLEQNRGEEAEALGRVQQELERLSATLRPREAP